MSAPAAPGRSPSGEFAHAAVALGGGHGLHASLTALRRLVDDLTLDRLTAVVTVADNGGSSGRLRGEFGVLPPGDLRMALAALCGDDEWGRTWADVLQHRFAGAGEMHGHVVGNLLIVSLWERLGDHVAALDWVGRLLGAQGRVLPMSTVPLDIAADVRGLVADDPDALVTVRGQVEVATTGGEIHAVRLHPADAPACPEAVTAVREADFVVLGPGSWFSSVIPHVLVPELRTALCETEARVVVVLNRAPQVGETTGYSPEDHLEVLLEHVPDLTVDAVVADRGSIADPDALERSATSYGARLVLADVGLDGTDDHHDPVRLAAVLGDLFTGS